MSGKISGKVWDLRLPHNQMLVLLAMTDHADHDGKNMFPSIPLIAWKTGYSEVQTQRIIRQLLTIGILVKQAVAPGFPILYAVDFTRGELKPEFKRKTRKNPYQNGGAIVYNPPQNDTSQNDTPIILSEKEETATPIMASLKNNAEPSLKQQPSLKDKEIKDSVVSDEPTQAAKPKSKRKPKRTEAENLAAENADPVFLAVGQSVFAIEDPTILTDSGRKRMRPIVGKSKLLFDRQFASTDNAVLRRILVAFAGSFEKGKCPRDYTKFEERFTAYLQSQAQNVRDLLAQSPAQPELPPIVDEATGQRDYSKQIMAHKRMLFAVGAIRAAEGMLEEYLKKNDDAA